MTPPSSGFNEYRYGSGLACSVMASIMFGAMPWLVQQLHINGDQLFWNRMLFGSLCLIITVTLSNSWHDVKALLREPMNLVYLIPGTILVGIQWWLFVWAPVNEQTKELALGYFLLPLTLALTGKALYGEQLSPAQKLAVVFAATGVGAELWQQDQLPWVSFAVAALYPVYFVVRRKIKAGTVPVMLVEHSLFVPFALFALFRDNGFVQHLTGTPDLWILLPVFGAFCVSSMLLYVGASKKLPFSLFGLLSYLEPALLFVVAIGILHEPVQAHQWATYSFIWVATLIITLDSLRLILNNLLKERI